MLSNLIVATSIWYVDAIVINTPTEIVLPLFYRVSRILYNTRTFFFQTNVVSSREPYVRLGNNESLVCLRLFSGDAFPVLLFGHCTKMLHC